MTFYLTGHGVALSMRRPVLVQAMPDRITMYRKLADARIANMMRLKAANRGSKPSEVKVWVEGLPGAEIALDPNPLVLQPGGNFQKTFELRAAPWPGSSDVNRFQMLVQASGEPSPDVFELTIILPEGKKK